MDFLARSSHFGSLGSPTGFPLLLQTCNQKSATEKHEQLSLPGRISRRMQEDTRGGCVSHLILCGSTQDFWRSKSDFGLPFGTQMAVVESSLQQSSGRHIGSPVTATTRGCLMSTWTQVHAHLGIFDTHWKEDFLSFLRAQITLGKSPPQAQGKFESVGRPFVRDLRHTWPPGLPCRILGGMRTVQIRV